MYAPCPDTKGVYDKDSEHCQQCKKYELCSSVNPFWQYKSVKNYKQIDYNGLIKVFTGL